MICGFCSAEQSIGKVCKSCSKYVVDPSVFHSHWEGGKGCRDKTRMSRNDPKKYANTEKTVSRKQQQMQNPQKKSK